MQQNTVDTNWINNLFAPLHDPQLLNRIFSYSTKEPWFFTEFSFLAVLVYSWFSMQQLSNETLGEKRISLPFPCFSTTNQVVHSWACLP